MDLTPWRLKAEIDWVTVGPIERLDWLAFPVLKASIVFADVARHELFSTSGTATSRIQPSVEAGSADCVVEVLLPSSLAGYVKVGSQFLVVRGSACLGIGAITDPGSQIGETGG